MESTILENGKKYKLTNSHDVVTIIEIKKNRVTILEGFSTGDAGTITEFMRFMETMNRIGDPIKIEDI